MDVIVLRSLTTLFMFLVFVGIIVWSLAARRRQGFDEAAQLPFLETPLDQPPADAPAASAQGEKP
jgi:cytochrome c oxidase cbb3-type subunit IV